MLLPSEQAGERAPLDPARAVKIHGRTGKWSSNSNTVELKTTKWRKVESMYKSGVIIPPRGNTHAGEQKRKPHESHKRLRAGPWMDVSEEAVRAPSGNCGSLRKPRGSGKQEEEQGADCNSPSYIFHRSPAAAAAVVRRKLLLNSTGNILIHFFYRFFFGKGTRVRLIGIFLHFAQFPFSCSQIKLRRGENSFLGWLLLL